MKVITVIGANGFIGRRLCKKLAEGGNKIIGISKNKPENIDFYEFHNGYNYELTGFEDILKKSDIVVFCAGHMRPSSPFDLDAIFFEASNVLKIARLCASSGVKKFLMTSSGGTIYGHLDKTPIEEDIALRPTNPYGYMHMIIENGLRIIQSTTDLTPVSLRVGNAFGPGQTSRLGQGLIPMLHKIILSGETFKVYGDGLLKRDYIFIDDIVSFFQAAIDNKTSHISYNVGTAIGTSVLEAINLTETITKMQIKREHVEQTHGTVASDVILDINRAKTDLGWTFKTSFKDGLEQYFKWAEQNLTA